MAESFLFNIAERVLEKIASLAIEEVSLAFNVKRDLKKLQETMTGIKAVLLDAELQQHQNEALKLSIWKLRDIFYDAEDVLDEFECDALQKEVVERPSTGIKVRCLASCFIIPPAFSSKTGHKIKEINERLDKIATDWNRFNLRQQVDNRRVFHRETHSFVNSSDVIGRDEDKENIISLLMKPSEGGNIPVISIVGIGGLGKTTLAQFVYNDELISRHFPLRIWVCVSEEFDLTRLLKEIVHSIDTERCDALTLNALQTRLRNLLKDKKFLLVLDDVWNEDRVKWIALRDLLNSSQNKIIVTTRSLKVASIMSSIPPYELKGLPHKDCLNLFAKWAFGDGDERRYPNLKRIEGEIVEKCKGVPLAVRTLGSLLFQKTDEREWISIRDNEIWRLEQSENDIIPVLKLSYYHLPSHLQRCLAYLSLYKKDNIYASNDVIQFWMSHRLLESPKQTEEWEDVGIRYVSELWSRCFIQEVEDHGCYLTFKMHDLIHDLALDVSQKECKIVYHQTNSIDERVRHLSFSADYPVKSVPQYLKKVRTIVGAGTSFDESNFINLCISNFKYLRALDLRYSSLEVLPDSIATLKLLRYLNLHQCDRLRELPSSFYKLQSLNIGGVDLMQFPNSMQSLITLKYLEITIHGDHFRQLIQPGCLSSLQYLCLYECKLENLFEGMQYLTSLRTLYVNRCYRFVSLPQNLTFLTKLEHLQIYNCHNIDLRTEPAEEEDQDLHFNLKTFSISLSEGFGELPRLLLEGSASTLQSIRLDYCCALYLLPEWLQNLTSLQKLEISRCSGLSSLPEGMDRLTALRQLKIKDCSSRSHVMDESAKLSLQAVEPFTLSASEISSESCIDVMDCELFFFVCFRVQSLVLKLWIMSESCFDVSFVALWIDCSTYL
ncbi:hypothetical protein CRYUN_Cryun16bG0033700 [Craigia yunnanensis]